MKKSTLEALYNLVNSNGEITITDELRAEVNAEYERTTAKSKANAALYDAAHDVIMNFNGWNEPMMVKELWPLVEPEMPEGFTASKMQYAFREKWNDEIQKHENGKDPFKYSKIEKSV